MENISTIKDRILTFLESEGIKKADFYSTTGISDSNFKGKICPVSLEEML